MYVLSLCIAKITNFDHYLQLPRYHTFISFCGFVLGFVLFVMLLEKGSYKAQFKQLAWTWMALFLVVIQASFWAVNTLDGLFWMAFPASLVICNDCMVRLEIDLNNCI